MSKIVTWCIGLALAGALAGCGQSAAAVRAAGSWGRAIEVPGLAALNTGGDAEVSSVSCASAGNCAAGGYYTDRRGRQQGFVASETERRLGPGDRGARPGGAEHGRGRRASARCRAPRRATARPAGTTRTRHGIARGSWPVERNGVWGQAIEVPGLAALNTGRGSPRSSRCRAPRRATARPAGTTRTGTDHARGSWSASGTASGARRSRCPAWRP